jgi:protein-disulfide isomerase
VAARNLRSFYVGLVAVAVIGGGAIFWAKNKNAPRVSTIAALANDTAAMPIYTLGNENAPINVDEYADFQCPGCRQFFIVTLPDIRDRLVNTGRIRWRFRNMPLPMHQNALAAHQAAACTGEQGKFWEMHDQLYTNQPEWAEARNAPKRFRQYAGKSGVDLAKYDECVASNRFISRLQAEANRAGQRGIGGTPTIVIGNTKIESVVYDAIKRVVDSLSPPPKKS